MKKYERIIVYGVAVFAVMYGFFMRAELQSERSCNRLRLAYYYPWRGKTDDFAELFISGDDYDRMIIDLVSNSLSESTCRRLGNLLYFWTGYQNRWRHRSSIWAAETKLDESKAKSAELKAILKWCESE